MWISARERPTRSSCVMDKVFEMRHPEWSLRLVDGERTVEAIAMTITDEALLARAPTTTPASRQGTGRTDSP